jgi:SAM-dependent methyltransferase
MPGPKARTPDNVRSEWKATYAKTPYRDLPWFSPQPYPWVSEAIRSGWWRSGARILDVGCGAGTNSLALARAGFRVSGIDLAEGAIEAARNRAERANLKIDFQVADALALPFSDGQFGGAIDIGCFHTLPVQLRRAYSKEIARVIHPHRSFVLSWVAREFRGPCGPPHRLSVEEVSQALENEFLFRHTEFRPSASGRPVKGAPAVYCAHLGRRSFPRPPPR